MVKKLYIMRHGQTLFNTQKRIQGACDSPLTEVGIEQAKKAKAYYEKNGVSFDYAFSSTQERATDTLKLVTDAPYEQLKGIKEMNFGVFEAREEELLPKRPEGTETFEDMLVPYGGEDVADLQKRYNDTINEIIALEHDTVLAVSHGAAMWAYVKKYHPSFPKGVFFTNCAILEFDVVEGQVDLVKMIDPIDDKVYPVEKEF